MRYTIICRADGNSETGLGHLYRMFALCEMFKQHFHVVFVTKKQTTLKVIPEAYRLTLIPEHLSLLDEAQWLSTKFDTNSTLIIADGYQFTSAYQKQIKNQGFRLAYVDDIASERMFADIIINHGPHISPKDYTVTKPTLFALGTKYAILRPDFLHWAKESRSVSSPDTAFVCFGGADPYDLSYKAAQALLQFSVLKTLHVVLGGAYKHNAIQELSASNSRLKLHHNLSAEALAAVMQESSMAIAPCSTILYELCCIKMPIISGYYVDNQKLIYKGLKETGAIYPVGDMSGFTTTDFTTHIAALLNLPDYSGYVQEQAALFDHKIRQRFIDLVTPVTFRKACLEDAKLLFNWANDQTVRANSYQSEPIDYTAHCQWFENQLKTRGSMFLIAQYNNEDAGLVRYTIKEENAVVGISIAAAFRGKGLAPKMLIESAKDYFKTNTLPIFAYIKQTNTPSIKSFEKAGYQFLKNEMVSGHQSLVYQLKEI